MNTEPNKSDGKMAVAAKVFWRTRQFWLCAFLVIATCVFTGYVIGNWVAANGAKAVLAQQERAYNDASNARKAVLQQCLITIENQNKRLAGLGDKAADAASAAADAVNKVAGDKPTN